MGETGAMAADQESQTCSLCCREGSDQRREEKEIVKPRGEMQEKIF